MPELAAFYALGVLVGFVLTAFNIGLKKRHRTSSSFRNVEANLRKIDLYWSDNEDRIVEWTETRAKDDASKGNLGFAIAGALISALSWLGVVFLIVLVVSEHYLARSRRERALFASPLGESENLSSDEVRRLVGDLNRAN
ncbi:MAG: hypothetical protein V4760_12780 [Bdellovibrionota bacterium]